MYTELQAVSGVGHRIYNNLGRLIGVAEQVLVRNAVVFEEGLLRDLGIFEAAVRGEVVAVWGLSLADTALEDDVARLIENNRWPFTLPQASAFVVEGALYRGYKDVVRTCEFVHLNQGAVFCDGASSIPQQ